MAALEDELEQLYQSKERPFLVTKENEPYFNPGFCYECNQPVGKVHNLDCPHSRHRRETLDRAILKIVHEHWRNMHLFPAPMATPRADQEGC